MTWVELKSLANKNVHVCYSCAQRYLVVAEVRVGVLLVVGVEAVEADDVEGLGGQRAAVADQHLVQVLCGVETKGAAESRRVGVWWASR